MTDDPQIAPGPTMDAELAGLMGVEPKEWRVQHRADPRNWAMFDTREEAEPWASKTADFEILPVHELYSTTDAGMGVVLDWLEAQGYLPVLETRIDEPRYVLLLWGRDGSNPRAVAVGDGFTRAEAVGRAALKTREQG